MTFKLNPGQERAMNILTSGKRYVQLYGGSRSGKTALLVSCIIDRALISNGSRHLVVRRTAGSAVKTIVMDTFPKIWKLKFPRIPVPKYNQQTGFIKLPNGSEIWIGGVNDDNAIERVLGAEYATIYINEASEVPYSAVTVLRTRLAQVCDKINGKILPQRFYFDLNPTTNQHWTYKLFLKGEEPEGGTIDPNDYGVCQINPLENSDNLSEETIKTLEGLGARAKKRFFDGDYSQDDENALWKRAWIKRAELGAGGEWPVDMLRVVVAIDPAASSKPGSDETGIIAAGLGVDKNIYVIEDESGRMPPHEWAHQAVALYHSIQADCIIAEVNNGGEMVENTIRAIDPNVSYKSVHASRGKVTRAQPIAALYERGKVYHCKQFAELEDQMCAFKLDFDRNAEGWSPDRADALVWAITEFLPNVAKRTKRHTSTTVPPIYNPAA